MAINRWGLIPDVRSERDYDIRDHVQLGQAVASSGGRRLWYKKYQRQHGACTGFGTERTIRIALAAAGLPDVDLSPLFAYYNNRIESGLSPTIDSGATIRGSMDAARKYGLCREELWTYANADGYLNVKPEPYAYADALEHQVLEAFTVPNNIDMIRQAIAQGFGVTYGTTVHRVAFEQAVRGTVQMPQNGDVIDGAHNIVLDTWDDSTARFGFPNYWERWGDDGNGGDGFGTVPYEHVSRFGFDLWAVRVVESPDPKPRPKRVQYIGASINGRDELLRELGPDERLDGIGIRFDDQTPMEVYRRG